MRLTLIIRTGDDCLVCLISFFGRRNHFLQSEEKRQSNFGNAKDMIHLSSNHQRPRILGNGSFAYLALHKDYLDKFFILTPPQGGLKARKIVFRIQSSMEWKTTKLIIDGFLRAKQVADDILELKQLFRLSSYLQIAEKYVSGNLELHKDE